MPPVITSILPQAGKKGRVSLMVDGELWLTLHKGTAEDLNLTPGEIPDAGRLREEILRRERALALERLSRFLNLRPRSVKEVRLRLARYGYEEAVIESLLRQIAENQIVEDSRFAQWWVREGIRVGKGCARLRQELLSRGVASEVVESALRGHYKEEEDFPRALEIARQRSSRLKGLDRKIAYRRMVGFIQRRGFSFQTANEVWHYLEKGSE